MATWVPLESNPDVLTKYIHKLGVSELWSVVDIFSLDPEALEFTPKPHIKYTKEQDGQLKTNPPNIPADIFYMKQCIDNACGTIALIHGIANCKDIDIKSDGVLKKYIDTARSLTAEERGKLLLNNKEIAAIHQEVAQQGQTIAESDEAVLHHYITFINHDNVLYEMDGEKSFPIAHGHTTAETLLEDAAKVCKTVMARDPDNIQFSVVAIAPTI